MPLAFQCYRIWDGKEMTYPDMGTPILWEPGSDYMFCTGKLTRDGDHIYHGDIIRAKKLISNRFVTVTPGEKLPNYEVVHGVVMYNERSAAFVPKGIKTHRLFGKALLSSIYDIYVEGNIYQDQGLITKYKLESQIHAKYLQNKSNK